LQRVTRGPPGTSVDAVPHHAGRERTDLGDAAEIDDGLVGRARARA
jgi:hypothetical protein